MNDSQALRFYMSTDDVVAKATPEARARLLSHAEVVTLDADLIVFEPSTDAGYSYYVVEGSVIFTRGIGSFQSLSQRGIILAKRRV